MSTHNLEQKDNADIESTKIVQVSLSERLKTIGLSREDISEEEFSDLQERYQKNLSLYERRPDLNIHKLEERSNKGSLSKAEKLQAFKDAMSQAEEQAGSLTNTTKVKSKELIEKKQSEIKNAFAKKIAEMPIIGGILQDLFNSIEESKNIDSPSFMKKLMGGVGVFILGFFGYNKFESDFNGVALTTPKIPTELGVGLVDKVKEEIIKPIDTLSKKEISTDALYKGGAKLLISLSGEKLVDNTRKKIIFDNLKNKSYEKLMIIKSTPSDKNAILGDDYQNKKQQELLDSMLVALTSEKTKTLLGAGIKSNVLEKIIFKKGKINDSLARHFGETIEGGKKRLEEIYEVSKKADFNWKTLSLKELSILYIKSVPAFALPSNNFFQDHKTDVNALMVGADNEIKDTMDSFIPGAIVVGFMKKFGPSKDMGGEISLETRNDKETLDDISSTLELESDKEDLQDIINFKNEIYKENGESEFINNPKLKLTPEQKEMFKDRLNYKWVISLYTVLGGDTNLNNINPISLPILVLTISHIIGDGVAGNKLQGAHYLGSYTKDALMGTDGDILTDEEREIMKIYGDKVVDVVYFSYLKEFYSNLGLISGVNGDLGLLALEAFGGGFVLNKLGSRSIKNGLAKGKISIFGKLLKKVGWIGMIFGTLVGAVEILSKKGFKTGGFESDINKSIENGNIKEAMELLKKHKESTEVFEKDGEKITIVSYKEDTPYAFYKGKVWFLNTIDVTGNISNVDDIESGISYTKNMIYDAIFASKTSIVDGVDVSKVRMEGRKIILGEGETKVVDIEDSIPNWKEENFKDLFKKIKDSVDNMSDGERDLEYLSGTEMSYIPIKELGEGRFLSLVEVKE